MIDEPTTVTTCIDEQDFFLNDPLTPGILIAFSPSGSTTLDRCPVSTPFTVGRSAECDLTVSDDRISKQHFRITSKGDKYVIEDLGSTNGTYLDGARVFGKAVLENPAVIRTGQAIMVFHAEAGPLLSPSPKENFGIAGRFHTGPLLKMLHEAAVSARHILLTGPSGSGKELSGIALSTLMGEPGKPLLLKAHNAARFATEEEATATLFGVGARVFSNVDARPGLIEQAKNGALFLDEIHNLPDRVQRTLLRTIEDDKFARIGETQERQANVRFILASNAPPPTYELAPDLLARLRVVPILPLSQRIADIPDIFNRALEKSFTQHGTDVQKVVSLLSADHYETLCLDGFPNDNIRGLLDIADRIGSSIATGVPAEEAVPTIFVERFSDGPVAKRRKMTQSESHYEQNKTLIIDTYLESEGNLSATQRKLDAQGVKCSRRWLRIYLTRWKTAK